MIQTVRKTHKNTDISIHVNIHHTEKLNNTFITLFKEDTIIFPLENEEENKIALKYIKKIMHENKNAYVTILALYANKTDCLDYKKQNLVKYEVIAEDVIQSDEWKNTEQFEVSGYYGNREILTIDNFVKKISSDIDTYLNYIIE